MKAVDASAGAYFQKQKVWASWKKYNLILGKNSPAPHVSWDNVIVFVQILWNKPSVCVCCGGSNRRPVSTQRVWGCKGVTDQQCAPHVRWELYLLTQQRVPTGLFRDVMVCECILALEVIQLSQFDIQFSHKMLSSLSCSLLECSVEEKMQIHLYASIQWYRQWLASLSKSEWQWSFTAWMIMWHFIDFVKEFSHSFSD